ncbi:MAG: hypothetical protein K2X97_18820, partial [Mycobacteriaceae bacterium]|nr:hypothetical protein [Mycobacteriaceae bacterium]
VPEAASKAIRAHRLAVLREDPRVDPLDGHLMLTRLKVAAALMALDGRTVVGAEDWSLAGYVMDVSNYTRERCQRALIEQSRSANTARALAAADREDIISERKVQRCKEGILRRLDRQGGAPIQQRELRRGLKSDIRDNFDAAAAELLTEETIVAGHDGRAPTYMRSTWTTESTPSDLHKQRVDRAVHVDPKPNRRRQRTRGKHRTPQQTGEATA